MDKNDILLNKDDLPGGGKVVTEDKPVIMSDDEMALRISNMGVEMYNKGALQMANAIIDTFRELGVQDKVMGREYSVKEIVDILKGIRGDGGK